MLLFASHSPALFRHTGCILVLFAFSICIFGFPQFYYSNWNAESISLGLHLLIATQLVWMGLGLLLGYLKSYFISRHVLILIWLGFIGWQILTTAFATIPLRSWLGPPEQGEGLAWYIAVSILMMMLSATWRVRNFGPLIIHFSFVVMLTLAGLHFVTDQFNNFFQLYIFPLFSEEFMVRWLPFVWPDYLGFMVAWWWIAAKFTLKNPPRWLQAVHFIALIFILLASSNRIAMILFISALFITTLIGSLNHRGYPVFTNIARQWRKMTYIALLLPVGWLLIGSWPGLEIKYGNKFFQSYPTRVILNHVTLNTIANDPSRLIFGKGWGQFQDDFFKNALVRDIRVYNNGRHYPNWHLIRGYIYHSHNMGAESLLALGLVGYLLWMSLPFIVAARLPARWFWPVMPMFVGITILQHFWFPMPQVVAFQALCWFLLMRHVPAPQARLHRLSPKLMGLGALLLSAIFIWSAHVQYQTIRYNMRLADPFGKFHDGTMVTSDYMKTDIARGGNHLRSLFISYTKRLALGYRHVTDRHIELYLRYIEASQALADAPTTGAYNGSTVMYGYNVAFSSLRGPVYRPIIENAILNYPHYALLHTVRAPKREDIIAPLLYALYHADSDPEHIKALELAQSLLEVYPAHRSALWVAGKILAEKPGFEEQGRDMMRTALILRADHIYLIRLDEIMDIYQIRNPHFNR